MARFRKQVQERVRQELSRDEVAGIVNLNRYLIGWGMYYRRVSSTRHFRAADHYVWRRVWRTTRRLRAKRGRPKAHAHYREHYIPYRFDMNPKNRWRKGSHYGVWADAAHTRAYIVASLAFLPIRYVRLHPQLNPYIPSERAQLDRDRGLTQLLIDIERDAPKDNPDYGVEWRMLRREVLTRAGHRCQRCRRSVAGRLAHVHHLHKLKQAPSRRRANLLENLIALCPQCHRREEREHDGR
jgi:Group II intron, maturase-specific domain/HNH endonuclease